MSAARISVASDDRLFRDGVIEIVRAAEPSFIVRAYDGGDDADVVLVDSRMEISLATCADLRRARGIQSILIAAPDDDAWASRAIGAGARGVVPRSADAEQVVRAIRVVRDGLIWAPRRVMAATIDLLTRDQSARNSDTAIEQRLSAREREVFRHAVRGLANKEVAGRLGVTEATVKVHLSHIFQKLGVRCRTQLAAQFYGIATT